MTITQIISNPFDSQKKFLSIIVNMWKIYFGMSMHHLLLLLATAFFVGCSNDFEVNAPAKDIPIVYGLLSLEDDIHYIRVERAFIDDLIGGNELAQDPDNLYYAESVSVSLMDVNTDAVFSLNRTDVSQLGLIRDEGIFAITPNILYEIDSETIGLNPATEYELQVDRADGSPIITARTRVVGNMQLAVPRPNIDDRFLQIVPNNSLLISLTGNPVNGVTFDVFFKIHYAENSTADQGGFVDKTIDWKVIGSSPESENLSVRGESFYEFLGATLEANQTITRRIFSFDITFIAGGQELSDFQAVLSANSGITGAEEVIPSFTNLSEGRGLFSSRNSLTEPDFLVTGNTIDSLQSNKFTRHLNFIK